MEIDRVKAMKRSRTMGGTGTTMTPKTIIRDTAIARSLFLPRNLILSKNSFTVYPLYVLVCCSFSVVTPEPRAFFLLFNL